MVNIFGYTFIKNESRKCNYQVVFRSAEWEKKVAERDNKMMKITS